MSGARCSAAIERITPESPWLTTLRGFARYGERVAVSSRGRTLTLRNSPRRPMRCVPP